MNGPIVCPKCQGAMLTHNRNGVHIEQCGQCRGIFLDFGELEMLTQMHTQWMAQQQSAQMQQQHPSQMGVPPQQGHPGWAAPQGHGYYKRKKGFMGMLFSS